MVQTIPSKIVSYVGNLPQAMAQNLASTYEEIKVAEQFIKFAIKYKKEEIVFKESTPKFLFALNIHNADPAYRTQL